MLVTSACGEIDGRTTNISRGGFLIQNRAAEPLKVGETYSLCLRRGNVSVEAVARVVASREDIFFENGALEFTDLSTSAQRQLHAITQNRTQASATKTGLGKMALVQRPVHSRHSVDRIG